MATMDEAAAARAWPPLHGPAWQADGGLPVTVEARTARLAARLYGVHGEPVVLLPHGPGCGAGYLAPVARLLAAQRSAALLDPRGAGQSLSLDHSFTVGDYVDDLEALRTALGVERLQLFGHGWGGLWAQLYAAALPQRVAGLVLCGAAPGVGLEWVWARRHETQALARGSLRRRSSLGVWRALVHLQEELGGDPAARRLYGALWRGWSGSAQSPPPDAAWLAGARSRPEVKATRAAARATSEVLPAALAAPYPVLVLYGEHDLYGEAARETVRDRFGAARHVVLSGAAHLPWLEKPAAFERELLAFYGAPRARELPRATPLPARPAPRSRPAARRADAA
jgi:proline iminopeptidase